MQINTAGARLLRLSFASQCESNDGASRSLRGLNDEGCAAERCYLRPPAVRRGAVIGNVTDRSMRLQLEASI